jgi:hypothetical protein
VFIVGNFGEVLGGHHLVGVARREACLLDRHEGGDVAGLHVADGGHQGWSGEVIWRTVGIGLSSLAAVSFERARRGEVGLISFG